MVKTESENLKKLREIVIEIENQKFNFSDDDDYQRLTESIDNLIHKEIAILGLIEGAKHIL